MVVVSFHPSGCTGRLRDRVHYIDQKDTLLIVLNLLMAIGTSMDMKESSHQK